MKRALSASKPVMTNLIPLALKALSWTFNCVNVVTAASDTEFSRSISLRRDVWYRMAAVLMAMRTSIAPNALASFTARRRSRNRMSSSGAHYAKSNAGIVLGHHA